MARLLRRTPRLLGGRWLATARSAAVGVRYQSLSSAEEEELDNLPFSEMVLQLADKATHLVKERLVAEDRSKKTDTEKEARVQGILNQIVTTNATLHISFPIHR
jgi:hypothetical protein